MRASGLCLPHSGKSQLFKRSGTICVARNLDFCSKTTQKYLTEIKLIYLSLQELDRCFILVVFPPPFLRQENTVKHQTMCFPKHGKNLLFGKTYCQIYKQQHSFQTAYAIVFWNVALYYSVLAHTVIHSQTPTTFNRVVWIHNGINDAVLHSAFINTQMNKL